MMRRRNKRKPGCIWIISAQGRQVVTRVVDGRNAMWLELALSYFMLCRASVLWTYAYAKVNPEFCLTRNRLSFLQPGVQVAFESTLIADSVQVQFPASKTDQKRAGCTITQTRAPRGSWGGQMGAFEELLNLFAVHSHLLGRSPSTVQLMCQSNVLCVHHFCGGSHNTRMHSTHDWSLRSRLSA